MFVNFIYILLAILGLSFLIFIHELGHYFMARRVGMRVETFSIGFGKPLFSWQRNGETWQIGWLLFGGYVKIAGAELTAEKNPYEIPDGFFGKKPIDRIKVILMGPLSNLIFALVAFTLLWAAGGRDKNFSEFTSKVGLVDPESELFALGVRPGDEITAYDSHPFKGSKDHLYAALTADDRIVVDGFKMDYATHKKIPFAYDVKVYPHPAALEKGILTTGITNPGSYILYDRFPDGSENPLPEGSPLQGSGIAYGDRIVWVDGEFIFSVPQLSHMLSGDRVLMTIERGPKTLLKRVPRVQVQELRPEAEFREELADWQFEAKLQGKKLKNLYTIPYNISNNGIVENQLRFFDQEKEQEAFPTHPFSNLDTPLRPGDKIIAISGTPITHAYELLANLQSYKVHVIVERNPQITKKVSWKDADAAFDEDIQWRDIQKIGQSIGTSNPISHSGNYLLLQPITPKVRNEFLLTPEKEALLTSEIVEQRKAIDSIEDPERRSHALRMLEKQEKRLLLGLPGIQDRRVQYNPTPTNLFNQVFQDIWRTLMALLSGALNPKWIAGPVGIVQMVYDTSMSSIKEALYWLGAISLNLGILNLLPIPVLDGGTLMLTMVEMVTRRRLPPKTMERIIFPFAILLIAFFIYLTYHDLLRLFGNLLAFKG